MSPESGVRGSGGSVATEALATVLFGDVARPVGLDAVVDPQPQSAADSAAAPNKPKQLIFMDV